MVLIIFTGNYSFPSDPKPY